MAPPGPGPSQPGSAHSCPWHLTSLLLMCRCHATTMVTDNWFYNDPNSCKISRSPTPLPELPEWLTKGFRVGRCYLARWPRLSRQGDDCTPLSKRRPDPQIPFCASQTRRELHSQAWVFEMLPLPAIHCKSCRLSPSIYKTLRVSDPFTIQTRSVGFGYSLYSGRTR